MTAIAWVRKAAALGLVMLSGAWFDGVARGQIAYQPVVSPILNGVALNVTPVVSADRRYVRMTLSPYFNTVNGFTTYSAQVGAVGGGNFAGMGGAIGGVGMGGPMAPMTGYSATGTYLAGDFPPPAVRAGLGFGGANDPFDQGGVIPMRAAGADRGPAVAGDPGTADPFAFADAPHGRSVRARKAAAARRQATRKAARRPTKTTNSRR